MDRKPKTLFQLDTPFTKVEWPEVSPQDQETILELLCSLLSPIGLHRSNHTIPSKGKRDKKRKRKEAKDLNVTSKLLPTPQPPPPEICSHVIIGLNTITRTLQELSKTSNPLLKAPSEEAASESPAPNAHFLAIFVPTSSSQPEILVSHLPQLVHIASLAHPDKPATRLVRLPKGCEARLCEATGLQRVSFVGILEGAPYSNALVQLVREAVPEVMIPWLEEVSRGLYKSVKIHAVETMVPVGKKDMKEIKVAVRC